MELQCHFNIAYLTFDGCMLVANQAVFSNKIGLFTGSWSQLLGRLTGKTQQQQKTGDLDLNHPVVVIFPAICPRVTKTSRSFSELTHLWDALW